MFKDTLIKNTKCLKEIDRYIFDCIDLPEQ